MRTTQTGDPVAMAGCLSFGSLTIPLESAVVLMLYEIIETYASDGPREAAGAAPAH
jgi:hypothetical protein